MKKKFDVKLTILLVSLFVSLLILILFNQSKVGLFFGFFLLGLTLVGYGYYRVSLLNATIKKTDEELDEEDDDKLIDEVMKELKQVKKLKRSTMVTFYLAGGLLVVFAFLMLI